MNKEDVLINIVSELRNQKDDTAIEKIATNMENNYKIPKGLTYSFTSRDLDRNFFDTTDLRLITLYIMEAFKVLGREEMLEDYIPKGEQQEAKQYDFLAYNKADEVTLPYEFTPTLPVNDVYSTKMSVKELGAFMNSGIINYNFDIQREAKLEIRTGEIIKTPNINERNVREMVNHLLNDSLKESTIYLNAAPTTSSVGDELIYDNSTYTLIVTEDTRIDVLDGFHRLLAVQRALRENPMIEFEFNVVFSNFTTSEAIKWQAQHSKATAWSKNRISEMQLENRASKVVKAIKNSDHEFSYLIYTGSRLKNDKSLITFNNLTNIIDEMYTLNSRKEEVILSEKLSKILSRVNELKQYSNTLKSQYYVYAFIKLFKEKYNNDVDEYLHLLDKLEEYLKNNDFNFTLQNTKEKLVKEETYSKVLELCKET
ncbi:hypothetical protein [Staphylococcus capitis]|uniref:hypothetical protein n=1 Tax=Staphylococcus capitis TaxID=29388 RepID=UPI003CF83280